MLLFSFLCVWRGIVSAEKCAEVWQGIVRGSLEGLQERGRAVGQEAGQQRCLLWPPATLTEAAREPQPSLPSVIFLVR